VFAAQGYTGIATHLPRRHARWDTILKSATCTPAHGRHAMKSAAIFIATSAIVGLLQTAASTIHDATNGIPVSKRTGSVLANCFYTFRVKQRKRASANDSVLGTSFFARSSWR